ncbi:HesA/MoeB/ThiF family protein [Alteromonas sediminis]|uniref:HesA/MoeB/ThiF family protein n=1 Tax=Alteromonas sediminis TaxID=2259342 RepID=A0A3N5Y2W1_9ALTE|nr:HesA/MoeB/ThiF family protein [Alteromonas sediminis]RPJ68142.1 HesA/MoeB/ThiF family protein [Alteromonas sediminis]
MTVKGKPPMDDKSFVRYYRHILMPQVGEAGQLAITQAKLMVVGVGGLGCPVSQYLVASGVGSLILIDHDKIELSNLQRQFLFNESDIGKYKVDVAAERLRQQNPNVHLDTRVADVLNVDIASLVNQVDIVLDCTDNIQTRYFINQVCVQQQKVLISASAAGMHGQLVSFNFADPTSPCYRCLFSDKPESAGSCESHGVLSPVLGIMGSLQATMALQIILGHTAVFNTLLMYDGLSFQQQRLAVTKNEHCLICNGKRYLR